MFYHIKIACYHPTVFQTSTSIGCNILVVYVDDILVIGSDIVDITRVNAYLYRYLTIWDLGTDNMLIRHENI